MPRMTSSKGNWLHLKYEEVKKAVEEGDDSAKTKLAWLKLSGLGGAEKDEVGAVRLLEERVKDKDGEAMWMLGICNEYGIGIEQNIERAQHLYGRSVTRKSNIGKFLSKHKSDERGNGTMRVYGE